ncbi:hypothetical protein Trydic_g18368 [Trypoxylus dichotomus]
MRARGIVIQINIHRSVKPQLEQVLRRLNISYQIIADLATQCRMNINLGVAIERTIFLEVIVSFTESIESNRCVSDIGPRNLEILDKDTHSSQVGNYTQRCLFKKKTRL